MMKPTPLQIRTALADRLRTAAAVLLPAADLGEPDEPTRDAARTLDALVRAVQAAPTPANVWLMYVAVSTVFPTADELAVVRRVFELSDAAAATVFLLEAGLGEASRSGSPASKMKIVSDAAVVDVDFAARHELHTGIQRVVRSASPLWAENRPTVFVAWTGGVGAYRELADDESSRIVEWGDHRAEAKGTSRSVGVPALIVPWRTAVVLAEVPSRPACIRLAALAESSGNSVTAIGYDCIPVVSADLLPEAEPNRFVKYLAMLKHAHGIAGISASATQEFAGFASMLTAQGLPGPAVFECALAAPAATVTPRDPSAGTRILSVGSFEPRKNQYGVLHAADILWREGLRFELIFVGGGGLGNEVAARVARMAKTGRPVSTKTGISEGELARLYRDARFTVFASLHEGYGLPVAESIAQGTPVITTNYGSTAEIAQDGGAVTVNPRDDRDLTDTMRRMLTDDGLIESLRAQIAARPDRTWQNYADELWKGLVEPAWHDARAAGEVIA